MKLPCAKCSADCGMFTWCESCMRAATVRGTQASRTLIEVRTAAEIYGFTGADDELARWLVKKLAPTLKQNISRTSGGNVKIYPDCDSGGAVPRKDLVRPRDGVRGSHCLYRVRVHIDCEFFEDGRTIELISLGAVREDGATFYRETLDAEELCKRSEWLMANVRPHLRLTAETLRMRVEIAREFEEFCGPSPEFWGYFGAYDWVAICQMYGRMIDLPSGWPMYIRDIKQEADRLGVELPMHVGAAGPEHDALADAHRQRDAHRWLEEFVLRGSSAEERRALVPTVAGSNPAPAAMRVTSSEREVQSILAALLRKLGGSAELSARAVVREYDRENWFRIDMPEGFFVIGNDRAIVSIEDQPSTTEKHPEGVRESAGGGTTKP